MVGRRPWILMFPRRAAKANSIFLLLPFIRSNSNLIFRLVQICTRKKIKRNARIERRIIEYVHSLRNHSRTHLSCWFERFCLKGSETQEKSVQYPHVQWGLAWAFGKLTVWVWLDCRDESASRSLRPWQDMSPSCTLHMEISRRQLGTNKSDPERKRRKSVN